MMKKINLLVFLLMVIATTVLKAQPNLEHTYTVRVKTVLLSNGIKYLSQDGLIFTLYNTDHTIYKQVDFTSLLNGYSWYDDSYNKTHISDRLINQDDKLEFFLVMKQTSTSPNTYFYINEDGVEVFDFDGLKNPQAQFYGFSIEFIKTAQSTTKMFLRYSDNLSEWTKVYSLPGTLPEITSTISPKNLLDLKTYPNPASTYTRVAYELPNDCKQGLIRVFDKKGKLVSEYVIGKDFNDVLINTSEFQAGIYMYQLWANNELQGTEKLIVVR